LNTVSNLGVFLGRQLEVQTSQDISMGNRIVFLSKVCLQLIAAEDILMKGFYEAPSLILEDI
jgi:hypothetical protein